LCDPDEAKPRDWRTPFASAQSSLTRKRKRTSDLRVRQTSISAAIAKRYQSKPDTDLWKVRRFDENIRRIRPMQPSEPDPKQVQILLDGLKAFFDVGGDLNQWALLLLGGGCVAMMSTSYRTPAWPWRLMYLLLLSGLGALCWTLWEGAYLRRVYAGAPFTARLPGGGEALLTAANIALGRQILAFQLGAALCGAWLILYALWWLFVDKSSSQLQEKQG
jgi:hypothetical protein